MTYEPGGQVASDLIERAVEDAKKGGVISSSETTKGK